MRIHPALAIVLLVSGLGATALAAQLPAQRVALDEGYYDEYSIGAGGLLASRYFRAGVFLQQPYYVEYLGGYPIIPSGLPAFFYDPPSLAAGVIWDVSHFMCASSHPCRVAAGANQQWRVVGSENFFFPGWDDSQAYQARVDTQTGTVVEFEYLLAPPGYPSRTDEVYVRATAINDSDVIAGWATRGIPSVGKAPIWWPSPALQAQELPRISGVDAGPFPYRINAAGVIVGTTAGSAPRRAAVWRPTYTGYVLTLLGELPGGTSSRVYDIGFFGGIVGASDDGSANDVAVIWRPTSVGYSVTPLPAPPDGSCSAATAINTNGDVAGNCTLGDGAERGVVWRKVGGTYELMHELEPLPEHTRSVAYALADDGQAGGGSGPQFGERAVVWPVVAAAPVQVPALSHVSLLCLAAVIAGATAATFRAR